jgi:hypothetical protein
LIFDFVDEGEHLIRAVVIKIIIDKSMEGGVLLEFVEEVWDDGGCDW